MILGDDRAIVGDAKADGLAAAWDGEAYARFREQLLGADLPDVCAGRSLYRGVF